MDPPSLRLLVEGDSCVASVDAQFEFGSWTARVIVRGGTTLVHYTRGVDDRDAALSDGMAYVRAMFPGRTVVPG